MKVIIMVKSLPLGIILSVVFAVISTFSIHLWAGSYEVGQTDKKFTVSNLTVKVGDTVSFKNNDSFFHNIFSLSDVALFDLGSFPQGDSRRVVFDTAGVVEVECAIHPSMQMKITIE